MLEGPIEPSQWHELAETDPVFAEVLTAMPASAMASQQSIPELRNALDAMVSSNTDLTGIKKTIVQIPVRDGTTIPGILYQPKDHLLSSSLSPLYVNYHGGGWCMGTPDHQEPNIANLARSHGVVTLSVDYRLAPEHSFPVPINDSWDALKWAAANALNLGADTSKGFLVGGESAGGQIAAVLSLLARDEKMSPPLTGVWLSVPAIAQASKIEGSYAEFYQSPTQNAHVPLCEVETVDMTREAYAPDLSSPLWSPLDWPSGLAGLPPTLLQVCGMDYMRDGGLVYEARLRDAGVKTKLQVFEGLPHAFWLFFKDWSHTDFYWNKASADGGKWLLSQQK